MTLQVNNGDRWEVNDLQHAVNIMDLVKDDYPKDVVFRLDGKPISLATAGLKPKRGNLQWMIERIEAAASSSQSKAGLIEDIQDVLSKKMPVKNARQRIEHSLDILKRNGGKLDVTIGPGVMTQEMSQHQRKAVEEARNQRLNPPDRRTTLEFDEDGKIVNVWDPKRKISSKTTYKGREIAMAVEIK